jgi:murein DD-endopeptidase MepM/ murein hydrolase activator NlpD
MLPKSLLFFSAFFFFFPFLGLAQPDSAYFRSPVDFPIELAGNFCELRNNHFHSGIDIRAGGKEGLPVYAAAAGFVSRIKVSPFGYGNALYIDHPNGQTTVYAHLLQFDSTIAAWVKLKQYENELFELDLFPSRNQFVFEKGQIIGLSGNSGGSEGPHLHFEIRNTQTEFPLNPLQHGIQVIDTVPPTIQGIMAIPTGAGAKVNGKAQPYWVLDQEKKNASWQRDTLSDTLIMAGRVNFELETWDRESIGGSKNGVFAYRLLINDSMIFECTFQDFPFDQTKYINAHLDYYRKKSLKRNLQRCYKLSSQKLKFYKLANDSVLPFHFKAGQIYKVVLQANDFKQLTTSKVFFVKGVSSLGSDIPQLLDTLEEAGEKRFVWDKINSFAKPDFSCDLPAGALYQNLDFQYQSKCLSGEWLSNMHKVHTEREPLQKPVTIKIKLNANHKANPEKILIVRLNEKNQPHAASVTTVKNNWAEAKISTFGNYIVTVDEKKPLLEPLNFKGNSPDTAKSEWFFKGLDHLAGIAKYSANIDGQWVLLAYDAKNNLFTCYWKDVVVAENKKHDLEVVLIDKSGNKAVLKREFFF